MNRKPLFGIGVDTILIYINTKHVRGPSGLGYINFGGWGLVFCNFKGHGDWLWKNWSRGLDPSEKRIEMQFAIPFIFKFFFADVIKIFWWKVWGRRVGRFHDRNAIHHTFHFQILFRWCHQNLLVEGMGEEGGPCSRSKCNSPYLSFSNSFSLISSKSFGGVMLWHYMSKNSKNIRSSFTIFVQKNEKSIHFSKE